MSETSNETPTHKSIIGEIINSAGVKSGVLEIVNIFCPRVAPVTIHGKIIKNQSCVAFVRKVCYDLTLINISYVTGKIYFGILSMSITRQNVGIIYLLYFICASYIVLYHVMTFTHVQLRDKSISHGFHDLQLCAVYSAWLTCIEV